MFQHFKDIVTSKTMPIVLGENFLFFLSFCMSISLFWLLSRILGWSPEPEPEAEPGYSGGRNNLSNQLLSARLSAHTCLHTSKCIVLLFANNWMIYMVIISLLGARCFYHFLNSYSCLGAIIKLLVNSWVFENLLLLNEPRPSYITNLIFHTTKAK